MDKIMLVWSRLSRRSRDISLRLNIDLVHIGDKPPYIRALLETFKVAKKAECIILQLPPGPALFWTLIAKGRAKMLCDVHTGMFHYRSVKEVLLNRPFRELLSRCSYILAHNDDAASILHSLVDSRVEVIYDPLPVVERIEKPGFALEDFILLPASWDRDEPIDYVLSEVVDMNIYDLHGIKLVITGDFTKAKSLSKDLMSPRVKRNVVFTGYLPWPQYYWLLSRANAVIALTTWKYTVLSSIWEAAAYNKPIIASYTPTLYKMLGDDAVYFKPGVKGSLVNALRRTLTDPPDASRLSGKLRRLSENSIRRLASIC